MAKMNLSYTVYQLLEFVPMLLILVVICLIMLIIQCIQHWSVLGSTRADKIRAWIYNGSIKIGKMAFGPPMGVFGKQEDDTNEVFIKNKPVPHYILFILGLFMLFFGLLAILVFWDVFLLRESNSCDNNIDCFAMIENNGSEENSTSSPVTISDCREYEMVDNVDISCFVILLVNLAPLLLLLVD